MKTEIDRTEPEKAALLESLFAEWVNGNAARIKSLVATSEMKLSARPHFKRQIAAFNQECKNAESRGLQIRPSVGGAYAYDPREQRVIGRKGSPEYTKAVSPKS